MNSAGLEFVGTLFLLSQHQLINWSCSGSRIGAVYILPGVKIRVSKFQYSIKFGEALVTAS